MPVQRALPTWPPTIECSEINLHGGNADFVGSNARPSLQRFALVCLKRVRVRTREKCVRASIARSGRTKEGEVSALSARDGRDGVSDTDRWRWPEGIWPGDVCSRRFARLRSGHTCPLYLSLRTRQLPRHRLSWFDRMISVSKLMLLPTRLSPRIFQCPSLFDLPIEHHRV